LGQFHRRPGLFADIFPRPCRPNPMVTVIAVAARNHRHLVERRAKHGIRSLASRRRYLLDSEVFALARWASPVA